jgi:multidrug efflux pump subunit AcrA (membrane-fusion protein)
VASRTHQVNARYVSPAPQTDASLPGATYFYLAEGQALRTGMRVAGQLQLSGKARAGVAVPEAAVVWHGGRAWAYVREDPTTFVRRPVSTAEEIGNAWFNPQGFEPGEQVVVSGAQLLLSEELKFQIRNENED